MNGNSHSGLPALPADDTLVRREDAVKVSFSDVTVDVNTAQVAKSAAILDGQTDALSVLFLHSGKFTSQIWVDTKTLDHVANWGFRAVAIDLPGKGKSSGPIDRALYADFTTALVAALGLKRVVFVSPSSSGRYTMPYLFRDAGTSTDRAAGLVPVAPAATQDYKDQYQNSKLPILIVYGTTDKEGPPTRADLELLPNSEVLPIEGAGHPCYVEQPEVFHEALYRFLEKVSV